MTSACYSFCGFQTRRWSIGAARAGEQTSSRPPRPRTPPWPGMGIGGVDVADGGAGLRTDAHGRTPHAGGGIGLRSIDPDRRAQTSSPSPSKNPASRRQSRQQAAFLRGRPAAGRGGNRPVCGGAVLPHACGPWPSPARPSLRRPALGPGHRRPPRPRAARTLTSDAGAATRTGPFPRSQGSAGKPQ